MSQEEPLKCHKAENWSPNYTVETTQLTKAVRHTSDCRCRRNNSRDVVNKELAQTISLSQQSLFVRLCISDLVDEKSNTTLGDDIRCAVANLDADNCLGSIDAKHWEQIHNRVCAPTDDCHNLRSLDLAFDSRIGLTVRSSCKADEELVDNVQEEHHGDEPTDPTR